MQPFITYPELKDHLNKLEVDAKTASYLKLRCNKVQGFLEIFDSLKQRKFVKRNPGSFIEEEETCFNTFFHFVDYREATIYIVKRSYDKTLLIEKTFSAPEISKDEFLKILPLNPQNYLTGYSEHWSKQNLYYANENIAFKVPLLNLLNHFKRHIKELVLLLI